MNDIIAWVAAHWTDILTAIASIIATATVIVKITPSPKDDALLSKIVAFIEKYIALNKFSHRDP